MTFSRIHRRTALGHAAALAAAGLTGCPKETTKTPATDEQAAAPPLTLLVTDAPDLGKAIQREWLGRTEQQLNIRDVTMAELAKATRLPGDVIVFPTGLVGQLAEQNLLLPLEPVALEDEIGRAHV